MIRKTLVMVIVLIGLVLSGCTEHGVQTDNDTTDTCMNATNATANASENVSSQSVSIPLEKPRFIEDR
jgi:PBP1b-binding outer membrane lipoprotein LpoB